MAPVGTVAKGDAARFDLLGIGNAIVDVVAPATPELIRNLGLNPGSMTLIDAAQAVTIYAQMEAGLESSGGSVGNSCAVAAILGARAAFIGKVADDQLGQVFRHDIKAVGVEFPTAPLTQQRAPTARCLILVTPDGERTMCTYLGACVELTAADVDPELVAQSAITYLEGYLFDPPPAQQAFYFATRVAREAGRRVALSLSDPVCVGRHRDRFRHLVREETDILFANEAEICSLYETDDVFAAAAQARTEVAIAVITRGAEGSLVLMGEAAAEIPAVPAMVKDTTGAGDAYAAGFLSGIANGLDITASASLGATAAARVIEHFGARPIGALDHLRGAAVEGFK